MEFGKKVTTSSADCQLWISRGVLRTYGFQREEAMCCFQKALNFDANCAMAHYFIAYNNAADYNNPDGMDLCMGFEEAQKALDISQHSSLSEWERALIEAQVHRFCWPVGSKPSAELFKNYANAMRLAFSLLFTKVFMLSHQRHSCMPTPSAFTYHISWQAHLCP